MPLPKSTAGFLASQHPRWLHASTALCARGQGEGRDSDTAGYVRSRLTLGLGQERRGRSSVPRGSSDPNQATRSPTRQPTMESTANCLLNLHSTQLTPFPADREEVVTLVSLC